MIFPQLKEGGQDLIHQERYLRLAFYAPGAVYRPDNGETLLNETCQEIAIGIDKWAANVNNVQIYWLEGLARTGKTFIAQTIVERRLKDKKLVASFFCSPDPRNNGSVLETVTTEYKFWDNPCAIFPTLAVQLAKECPTFCLGFFDAIDGEDAKVFSFQVLDNLLEKLIVEPLQQSDLNLLIVIDGLDQCKNDEHISDFLSILRKSISKIPKLKVLITSRSSSEWGHQDLCYDTGAGATHPCFQVIGS